MFLQTEADLSEINMLKWKIKGWIW